MTDMSSEMTQVLKKALVTQPLDTNNGYTYTYTSLLGVMLRLAEEKYGERDKNYTLLGFEFCAGIPQIWYPDSCKHIIIQMSLECLTEIERGCYQLAHECIHLLSPLGKRSANILEEGLATYFSGWYMQEKKSANRWHSGLDSYTHAERLVTQLLALDPNAIKVLRQEEPTISKISSQLILKYYPTLPEETAIKLAEPFDRDWVAT